MSDTEKLKRKLRTVLKLSGFTISSELSAFIVETFATANVDFDENFDQYVKIMCDYLEKHSTPEKSIEKDVIERAIETCFHLGIDEHETKFSVISAFDYPRLKYDLTRKHYYIDKKSKFQMIADGDKKIELFVNRYMSVLQRAQRCFKKKNSNLSDEDKFHLCTVDTLLTSSRKILERKFILGSLFLKSDGRYFIEDSTGKIELDLTYTKYHVGFFYENIFVLVNGIYADKILKVTTMMLPPTEEFKESLPVFSNLNYFGGQSEYLLRESVKLTEFMQENEDNVIIFISDLWLDKEIVFQKLEVLFEGFVENPPIAFVFLGDFLYQRYVTASSGVLINAFRRLGEIIKKYDTLWKNSHFVFVPGLNDPHMPHILPRIPLPTLLTKDFQKVVPKAIFTTNPCRMQYCSREIVVYRNDMLAKFMQDSLKKPTRNKLNDFMTKTILSQAHLSPFSLNSQPVHWNFDYTLHLYPLPNLLVMGDRCNPYGGSYKGCTVINPGCFIESGFSFKTYIPATGETEDCSL